MTLSSCFCPNNTKNMFVKIVHPGGHAELHDTPVLAAEVMLRNPRCCVAYPNVFQQPSTAVVSPETMLVLGQKYYVVPMSSIRKLQRLPPQKSPATDIESPQQSDVCPKPMDVEVEKNNIGVNDGRGEKEKEMGCLGEGKCFMCLFRRIKVNDDDDDSCQEVRPSNMESSSKKDEHTRKRAMEKAGRGIRGSPKRRISFDLWQPSLESIQEE